MGRRRLWVAPKNNYINIRYYLITYLSISNFVSFHIAEHHMSYEAGADTSLPKDHIKCPGCRQEAEPETEFVSLDQIGKSKPKLRILNLPVLCRNRQSDGKFATLGHPAIAQVPNQISSRDLHTILKPFMPAHGGLLYTF